MKKITAEKVHLAKKQEKEHKKLIKKE